MTGSRSRRAWPEAPPLPWLRLRLPHRWTTPEILDGEVVPQDALERALDAMGEVNRVLGGIPPVARALLALDRPRLTLLDVGTGSGAFPWELARRLRREGVHLRWAGVDLRRRVLTVARTRGGRPPGRQEEGGHGPPPPVLLAADGRALPFRDRAFDVVLASLTLHHLEETGALRVLEEMGRVARLRVLVSDLQRHPVHYAGARLLAGTVWRRDPVTRVDGPLSVLRGFTPGELQALGRGAGLRRVQVARSFPFRLLLSADPA